MLSEFFDSLGILVAMISTHSEALYIQFIDMVYQLTCIGYRLSVIVYRLSFLRLKLIVYRFTFLRLSVSVYRLSCWVRNARDCTYSFVESDKARKKHTIYTFDSYAFQSSL